MKIKKNNTSVSAIIGVVLMVAIVVAIASVSYVYITSLANIGSLKSMPAISWDPDKTQNQIKIIQTPKDIAYATNQEPNLVFKHQGTEYYVNTTHNITTFTDNLETADISAADTITGFTDGEWTIIWKPTDDVLGIVDL